MAPANTLTIVLPAFNEAERIGPALDELFGYLEHRNPVGRDGAPGAAALPDSIEVLVVDDGSSDNTADLVRARPETTPNAEAGTTLRVLVVPHAGKGAAVRAGILAAQSDIVIFADADMATPPDQLPLLVDALETHDVALGSQDPAGWLGHASVAAVVPADAREGVPLPRLDLGRRARSRTRSAASRGSGARSPTTCSRASRSRVSCSTSS